MTTTTTTWAKEKETKQNKTIKSNEWSVPPSVWDYCVL
jgi:hypothetical protein